MPRDWAIRDARAADLEELTEILYADHPAVHRDRLQAAEDGYLRFLVAETAGHVVGFCLLLFLLPPSWNGVSAPHLPMAVSLHVREEKRGRGIGSSLLRQVEQLAQQQGHNELFLRVDPVDNPQALALYRRLGYQPLQQQPYRDQWQIADSDGFVHQGEEWALDLVKRLR